MESKRRKKKKSRKKKKKESTNEEEELEKNRGGGRGEEEKKQHRRRTRWRRVRGPRGCEPDTVGPTDASHTAGLRFDPVQVPAPFFGLRSLSVME